MKSTIFGLICVAGVTGLPTINTTGAPARALEFATMPGRMT